MVRPAAKASDGRDGERDWRQRLTFIDLHRQRYADRVSLPCDGDFLIGGYQDDGVGNLGEFKIELHYLGSRRRTLDPQLCAFGDGAGALGVLFDLAGGDLGRLLSPVRDNEEFSGRLLDLGLRDGSQTPLEEAG